MGVTTDVIANLIGGSLRGWAGSNSFAPARVLPETPLKLYDMEASPYCRLVREVLTELDLDVMILPCPVGGTRFRPEAERIGGKQQFPLLVDDNTGTVMYESAAIIDYLGRTYKRRTRKRGPMTVASSFMSSATLWRLGGVTGMRARPSKAPTQPLELFSFETSPYSKPVRARLCELELPYLLRNTAKAAWKDMGPPSFRDKLFKGPMGTSRNRKWLAEHTGRVQVPYLIDANTGTAMYESADILRYLDSTYGA